MLRANERDIAEAFNAVGLSEDPPDAPEERQSLHETSPSLVVIRTIECDVTEARDAGRLAVDVTGSPIQVQSLFIAGTRSDVVPTRKKGHIAKIP
jgi:hypothetical protein